MKTRKPIHLLSAISFMGVTMAAGSTGSAPPASASAVASASVAREPPPEPLEAQAIPKAPSKPPTLEEWKTATPIDLTRRSRSAWPCRAYRVREWLKVKCQLMIAEIRQFGGSPEGVFLWIGPKGDYGWDPNNGGEVVLPMRPGDRRIVQFFQLVPNACFGVASDPSVILDEAWIEGEKGPTVVLR